MAEALVAFGIACNVIQVISFAGDCYTACSDIYHGRPTIDSHREAAAESMVAASKDLQDYLQSFSPQDDSERALLETAKQCVRTAQDMHREAQKVTSQYKAGNIRKLASAFAKGSKQNKKLSRLNDTLCGYRRNMDTQLLVRIW